MLPFQIGSLGANGLSHVYLTLGCKAPTTADENVARQRVLCPAIGARGIAPYKIFLDQGEHSLPAGSRSGATFKYSYTLSFHTKAFIAPIIHCMMSGT